MNWKETREFWTKNHIRKKLEHTEKTAKGILGYVEGPPTLNGIPHIGHARGRIMKDIRYRWKTMEGYYMPFWAGWDCQGLPVELEVEKLLGVRNKRESIENFGMERFIEECKKAIMRYHEMWLEADGTLALPLIRIKLTGPTRTSTSSVNGKSSNAPGTKACSKKDTTLLLIAQDAKPALAAPKSATRAATKKSKTHHSTSNSKSQAPKTSIFLVWTTMPFTIITDTMLAVQPNAEYVKVKVGDETWIMVRQRVEPVMAELEIKNYQIIETVPGKSLEGTGYDYPLKDIIPKQAELETKHPLFTTL